MPQIPASRYFTLRGTCGIPEYAGLAARNHPSVQPAARPFRLNHLIIRRNQIHMAGNVVSETVFFAVTADFSLYIFISRIFKQIDLNPTTKDAIPAIFCKYFPSFVAEKLNVSEFARLCG